MRVNIYMKESAKVTFDMKAEQKEKRERNEIPVSHASTMHDRWKSEPKGFARTGRRSQSSRSAIHIDLRGPIES